MSRDPRVDDYIAASAPFAPPILAWLRERIHAACPGVEESIKWGMPAFAHSGRPLAQMAAFKHHATFSIRHRSDPTGKDRDAMGEYGRIADIADLPSADEIERDVREAVALIDAGTAPRRPATPPKAAPEVPPALAEALAGDPAAAASFDGFPVSARRDYCEWIADAKRTRTRHARVAKALGWLREGKRRHWKYETR